MKIRAGHSTADRATVCRVPSMNTVAAAVAAVLAAASGSAHAQEASSIAPLEEVVVSGIRFSIEESIATKRESTSVIEVVSAEDIGKLPDTSIADSIARLPGVTAQRIDGRPAAISIRGLGEDYAGALLNGRQVVSSSEGRAAEYDQFPSELVNKVLVYKTVDAGLIGQGLSGTIDIRPLMPLSLDDRQVALGLRAEQNTNGNLSSTGNGEYGTRYSASYVDQFADHRLGVAVGYAHLDSPGQAKKYGAWAFGDYNGQWGSVATGVPHADGSSGDCFFGSDCAVFQQGFESSVTSSEQVRDGLMGVVEFRPNERFSSVVDFYYSKFEQDRVGHHWVGDIGLWNGSPADFSNVGTSAINGNTVIDSATVAGGQSYVYNKNWDRTDKITSVGWRNELDFGNEWKGAFDLGYSRAARDELYIQSVARGNAFSSFNFSSPGTSNASTTSWSTPQDLTDPDVVQLTNDPNWAEMRNPDVNDKIQSAQLSASRSLSWGWFNGLDVGVAYNQRDKDVVSNAFLLTLTGASDPLLGLPLQAIPASALRAPVMIDIGGIRQRVLSWDVASIMDLYAVIPKGPWEAQSNKFAVHEKVGTGFLKLDIGSTWGTVPVRGNLGAQFVYTDQGSEGFAWNDDGTGTCCVTPVHGGANYTDVLPSLNLVFDLKEDLILRFGLGKTMARPRMDDMRAGADQPILTPWLPAPSGNPPDPGQWTANGGGKPELRPWRADSVDLSLERYFQKRSYVAVAGFLKDLKSFIYERTTERDFSGFPNFDPALTPGCAPSQPDCDPNIGTITTQDNGSGGKVYGFEVSASLDGSLFTPALDGIGLILSYADTQNSLPKDDNGNPIDLDGFSGTVYSIGAYFERGGFSARINQWYRSSFTATTRGVILNTLRSTHIDAESQVDAQIAYVFNSGALSGLTLLLQGNNLTNEHSVTRQSPETVGAAGSPTGLLPSLDDDYGRVLLIGASYKL